MLEMADSLKVTCAYIVIFIFITASLILLATTTHLIHIARIKRVNLTANKQVLTMIVITLFTIFSFLISILLIIAVLVQVILIDGHKLHNDPQHHIHEIYYASFEELEYLIVIFDQFGHLGMIAVFIVRLQICFANSIFGYTKKLISTLYLCLLCLTAGSVAIIVQITDRNLQNAKTIILCSIVWEILIEIFCLFILYLFVSKLQDLVQASMGTSRKELRLTISYNMTEKTAYQKSRARHDHEHSRNSRNGTASSVELEPSKSKEKSPIPPTSPTNIVGSPKSATINKHSQIVSPRPSQTVLNNQRLINVMTKMTLLVVIGVVGSLISIVGNIYIEWHEMHTLEEHTADIQSMWAFLLPVIDMMLSSMMLYLQFDFTKHIYSKLCMKLDIHFLQCCGKLIDKEVSKAQHHAEHSEKSKESKTRSLSGKKCDTQTASPNAEESNGAETPIDRAITPRPMRQTRANSGGSTLDLSTDSGRNSTFRAPSPSPSPLIELPMDALHVLREGEHDKQIKEQQDEQKLAIQICNTADIHQKIDGDEIAPEILAMYITKTGVVDQDEHIHPVDLVENQKRDDNETEDKERYWD